MNVEDLDDDALDRPVFAHHPKLRVLERQLYGHVRAAIDLDTIANLEHHVAMILLEDEEMDDDLGLDLSAQLIASALLRVIGDPARYMNCGPPPGITKAEARAVAFEEACPFCVSARDAKRASTSWSAAARADDDGEAIDDDHSHNGDDDEPCACCEMLANSWREEHADVLAKAGLGPPSAASAIAGAIEIAKRDRARRDKPS